VAPKRKKKLEESLLNVMNAYTLNTFISIRLQSHYSVFLFMNIWEHKSAYPRITYLIYSILESFCFKVYNFSVLNFFVCKGNNFHNNFWGNIIHT
jgi:hypothetical protein